MVLEGDAVLHTLWSVKGGSGVTVVAAALASVSARRDGRAVIVDLAGDQPAALGLAEPSGPGVGDWLAMDDRRSGALERLLVEVDEHLALLPLGGGGPWSDPAAEDLAAALVGFGHPVVVDAGTWPHGPGPSLAPLLRAGESFLVIRPCYLALRRAVAAGVSADGVVLVSDIGRSLDRRDVAEVLGVPVVASIEIDPVVTRSVDGGVLVRRLPRAMHHPLRSVR